VSPKVLASLLIGATACGPLSLELGDDIPAESSSTGGIGTGAQPPVDLSTGGGGNGTAPGNESGSLAAGGSGGSAGATGAADSCPLDVAVGVDCSQYPAEATCKLGDEYYHCEQGLWTNPDWMLDFDPGDLACPSRIADGTSCEGYAFGARCCVARGECYACSAGQLWSPATS
jgi:hypothetical protein